MPSRIKPDGVTVLRLWVRAGGRCEFNGCNEYLLTDNLTLEEANLANVAHIVAAEEKGPRGESTLSSEERSKIENLMLTCLKHHKIIDDNKLEEKYPVELLSKYKKEHEKRILELTDITEGNKTFVIRLKGKIAGEAVAISNSQVKNAILPRYMMDSTGAEIDLTSLPDGDDPAYWEMGKQIITQNIGEIFQSRIGKQQPDHISVFAIGPIPLLIFLGNQLSNAVETDLYHLHKDVESWTWKTDGETVKYKTNLLSKGKDDSSIALLLSLSGPVKMEDLPESVRGGWVYEITLDQMTPSKLFMRKTADLLGFKRSYREFLSKVREQHGGVKEILLFPAVPTPVAVMCGRDLIKKTDPALKIYDFNKSKGGFMEILSIN